jgi:hypothetical protein
MNKLYSLLTSSLLILAAPVIRGQDFASPGIGFYSTTLPYPEEKGRYLVHLVWDELTRADIAAYRLERAENNGDFILLAEKSTEPLKDIMDVPLQQLTLYNNTLYTTETRGQTPGGRFIYNDIIPDGVSPLSFRYRLTVLTQAGELLSREADNSADHLARRIGAAQSRSTNADFSCPEIQPIPLGFAPTGNTRTLSTSCCTYEETEVSRDCTVPVDLSYCVDCDPACGCTYDPCWVHDCSSYYSCGCTPWTLCETTPQYIWVVTSVLSDQRPQVSPLSTNTLCGTCTGTASVLASGNLPLSYAWNNGSILPSAGSALCIGSYLVTVTDAAGCYRTASITVLEPDIFNVTATVEYPSCSYTCNGSVSLSVNPALPPLSYRYTWSHGPTTPSLTSLCDGVYTVTVSSSPTNCQEVHTFDLHSPNALSVMLKDDTVCKGRILTKCAASAGATFYSWSTGSTAPCITITAGTSTSYSVTVSNAAGCTASASFLLLVSHTPPPWANPATICPGESATLMAVGSAGSYYWYDNPGGAPVGFGPVFTTPVLQSSRTYYVNVVPGGGCDPSPFTAVHVTVDNCNTVGLNVIMLSGNAEKDKVTLAWSSLLNTDLSWFLVEKSTDGKEFRPLIRIQADRERSSYSVADKNPEEGLNHYRVVLQLSGGRNLYSEPFLVPFARNPNGKLLSNPVKEELVWMLPGKKDRRGLLTIADTRGVFMIKDREVEVIGGKLRYDVSELEKGAYIITAKMQDALYLERFIKQ